MVQEPPSSSLSARESSFIIPILPRAFYNIRDDGEVSQDNYGRVYTLLQRRDAGGRKWEQVTPLFIKIVIVNTNRININTTI